MKHTRSSKKGERKNHREKIIKVALQRFFQALLVQFSLRNSFFPYRGLQHPARLAIGFFGGSGLGATTSPGTTPPPTSSRESTTMDSGLKMPSISLSFAFDSASLARSPAGAVLGFPSGVFSGGADQFSLPVNFLVCLPDVPFCLQTGDQIQYRRVAVNGLTRMV